MRGGVRRLFIIIMVCATALNGCAAKPALKATPEPTATPVPETTVTPQATPVAQTPAPMLLNPVEEFWDSFEQAGNPIFSQMNLEPDSGLNLDTLDKTLAIVQHMQHLQQLFLSLTALGPTGSDAVGWSGLLAGGMEGTGSIQTNGTGYTFSCAYSDSSVLSGTLVDDVLEGEWQAEGRLPRSGEILHMREQWFALCLWDRTGSLMMLDEDTLWFAQGMSTIPDISQPPAQWADWSCREGVFTEYMENQTQIEEGSR